MGTSPPKQKALASVTLSARMVAAAASAALPPAFRISRPASTAPCPPATTAPLLPDAFQFWDARAWARAAAGNSRATARAPGRAERRESVMGGPPEGPRRDQAPRRSLRAGETRQETEGGQEQREGGRAARLAAAGGRRLW